MDFPLPSFCSKKNVVVIVSTRWMSDDNSKSEKRKKRRKKRNRSSQVDWVLAYRKFLLPGQASTSFFFLFFLFLLLPVSSLLLRRLCPSFLSFFLACLPACFTQISTSNSRWYILTCINTCDGRNEPTRNSSTNCGHRLRMKDEKNLWFISFSRRNPGWELALKLGEAGHRNPKPSVVGISATCSGTLFLF